MTIERASSPRPQVFILPLHRLAAVARTGMPGEPGLTNELGIGPEALARAIATSPFWSELEDEAALVVRGGPAPALAIFGRFDEAHQVQIEALAGQLESALPRIRYVDYHRAARDCADLAERLAERFGGDELAMARFTALPRGGFIVLGMLSYVLDLPQDRMVPPYPGDLPLVVVDDCALTGARFRRFLSGSPHADIIFAPLYSHPDLRAAIERRETRVRGCASAHDLHDHAPALQGERYPEWRREWEQRSGSSVYWVGQPDHVCFAWSEPDITLWNPASGSERAGWRMMPPELCLKNRAPGSGSRLSVQVQPPARGELRPPEHVLYARLNGTVIVADALTGASVALDGTAGDMWAALVEHGGIQEAARVLSGSFDAPVPRIEADLRSLVTDLRARGLLEGADAS